MLYKDKITKELISVLIKSAFSAREKSYAPYSKFHVGAAVLADDDKIYTGCNVENSSFGMTICAERCAIFKAVSEGEREILAVAIYSPNADDCNPCGACRQVMYEFQGEDGEVEIITESMSELIVRKLSEYLPYGFKI